MDGSAEAIGSVNTIVNTGGQLRAYNTDYLADYQVPVDHAFAVLGSGGMARPWPSGTAMPGGPRLAPAGPSCW